jgi:hypothetical protein
MFIGTGPNAGYARLMTISAPRQVKIVLDGYAKWLYHAAKWHKEKEATWLLEQSD